MFNKTYLIKSVNGRRPDLLATAEIIIQIKEGIILRTYTR